MWPFRKKPTSEPLPAAERLLYTPLGIHYFNSELDVEINLLEEYYAQLKKIKSFYSSSDIDKLNQQSGFDLRDGIHFIPKGLTIKGISVVYMFLEIDESKIDGIDAALVSAAKDELKISAPLTRVDIQNVTMKAGFDVYNSSKWKPLSKIECISNGDIVTVYAPVK